jgi:Taurine catabolism dioxygenase TauD, TfdA family
MDASIQTTAAAWRAPDLKQRKWVFKIDGKARAQLASTVKAAFDPDRPLFDYGRDDFDLGLAAPVIAAAMQEAHHGGGLALVKGLPREELSEAEFRILAWAIGLHHGVPRPQGRATQYISEVRDVGTDYRASNGRGFSSNAKLDFHADGADIAVLVCYNKAKSGGQSMVSSSVTAREILLAERPDLGEVAHQDFYFSRQQEQTEDEGAAYGQPLFDTCEGRVFGKWNRNRVQSAQNIDGVPKLSAKQRETMDMMDAVLQRPDVMFTMWLEPGDMQLINNHTMLHSRTDYVDYDEPSKKRLLHRLWLAPPDSVRLPRSWGDFYRSVEPGTVRGGIRGHAHDEACKAFERRQANDLGMSEPD